MDFLPQSVGWQLKYLLLPVLLRPPQHLRAGFDSHSAGSGSRALGSRLRPRGGGVWGGGGKKVKSTPLPHSGSEFAVGLVSRVLFDRARRPAGAGRDEKWGAVMISDCSQPAALKGLHSIISRCKLLVEENSQAAHPEGLGALGAPRLGPSPRPRPGPHHPRPGAPRRQRRSDSDGRGRPGRPLPL